ncbi:hypothetical protein BDV96DRAFT_316479 [Lophiotrema nucula]|uniref:Uncharacterized protein n=1 Tax=Lophiotrema nucula TaxID=690887 RepID=A0A6A5ZLD8_9PLEO|nr:hypothetical protein BDV96DRAFT_316479 [Lophiotrema nucula]
MIHFTCPPSRHMRIKATPLAPSFCHLAPPRWHPPTSQADRPPKIAKRTRMALTQVRMSVSLPSLRAQQRTGHLSRFLHRHGSQPVPALSSHRTFWPLALEQKPRKGLPLACQQSTGQLCGYKQRPALAFHDLSSTTQLSQHPHSAACSYCMIIPLPHQYSSLSSYESPLPSSRHLTARHRPALLTLQLSTV